MKVESNYANEQSHLEACAAMQMITVERFLNPSEAADFLGGLRVRTLVKWAREGLISSYPLGEGKRRLWRFRTADLTEWMSGRKCGAA